MSAEIAVFRSDQHARDWMHFWRLEGTFLFDTLFPVPKKVETVFDLDGEDAIPNLKQDDIPKGWVMMENTIEEMANALPVPEVFHLRKFRERDQYVEFNKIEWDDLVRKYPVSNLQKSIGNCCLCQHTYGMMLVIRRYLKKQKKGGYITPCVHNRLRFEKNPKKENKSFNTKENNNPSQFPTAEF